MRWSEEEYAAHMARQKVEADRRRGGPPPTNQARPKYRNVKVEIDGIWWDSKLEGARYRELKVLAEAGRILDLKWKVPFELHCPVAIGYRWTHDIEIIARYIADFVYYRPDGELVVEDTKGTLTAMYRLKRKWMFRQYGIRIAEVYAKERRRRARPQLQRLT